MFSKTRRARVSGTSGPFEEIKESAGLVGADEVVLAVGHGDSHRIIAGDIEEQAVRTISDSPSLPKRCPIRLGSEYITKPESLPYQTDPEPYLQQLVGSNYGEG